MCSFSGEEGLHANDVSVRDTIATVKQLSGERRVALGVPE
jgi:hypothetical protein